MGQKNEERKGSERRLNKFLVVMVVGLVVCLFNAVFLHQNFSLNILERKVTLFGISRNTLAQDMKGKERLLSLLQEAGYLAISRESLQQLPTWEHVVELYGDSPRIIGLETCKAYQNTIDARHAYPVAAGPFNSGTNLLAVLLWRNCALPKLQKKLDTFPRRWEVNNGKHQPPETRAYNHVYKSINTTFALPVVAVRDPYTWMQSLCRQSYTARWFRTTKHCPNLVPNDIDLIYYESLQHDDDNDVRPPELDDGDYVDDDDPQADFTLDMQAIPVSVRYKNLTKHHASLADMWSDWYNDYYRNANFPRIFVRMEDLVFHPRNVTEQICKCAGGSLREGGFRYKATSAKKRDKSTEGQYQTTMLDAMIRYGSATNADRTKGMTQEDKDFARLSLRRDLMDMFGYRYPEDGELPVSTER